GPNGEITWNDTWVYTSFNDTWTQIVPVGPVPPPRAGASLLFDANTNLYVMHGGYASSQTGSIPLNDTWVFDGTSWTDLSVPLGSPAGPRVRFAASEGPGQLHVLFGGAPTFFGAPLNDTWMQGALAQATPFGAGCQGTNGIPSLSVGTQPVLGSNFRLDIANLPPSSSFAFGVTGFSDTNSPLGPLPLSLALFGLPASCTLLTSSEASNLIPVNGATGSVTFA